MEDIPEDVRKQLSFHPVSTLDEAFAIALLPPVNGTPPAARPQMMEQAEAAVGA
jgi:ATP-dependent Lon protease